MSAPAAIQAEQLVKSFAVGEVQVHALNGVSLTLNAGELTLLMGPSGSGKSTLAATLGALQRPSSGRVTAFGRDLTTLGDKELDRFRLKRCGFIFQSVNLFQSLTARDQIILAQQFIGQFGRNAKRAADKALDEVNMLDKARLKPRQMSGGENQRVAIARALAMDPKLIFADEPTSALDGANGQIVVDLLHRAAKSHGAMVLCVTHDERLRPHADRVMRIEDGVLTADERANGTGAGDAA